MGSGSYDVAIALAEKLARLSAKAATASRQSDKDMIDAGFALKDLVDCGYTVDKLKHWGAWQLMNARFAEAEMMAKLVVTCSFYVTKVISRFEAMLE